MPSIITSNELTNISKYLITLLIRFIKKSISNFFQPLSSPEARTSLPLFDICSSSFSISLKYSSVIWWYVINIFSSGKSVLGFCKDSNVSKLI